MTPYQTRCMDYVRQFIDANVLPDGGQRLFEAIERKYESGLIDQTTATALPVGMAADPAWGGQAHPQADELRALALKLADAKARLIHHASQPGEMALSFGTVGFGPTVDLLSPHATAKQRRLWDDAMARYLDTARPFLLSKRDAWGKPGPFTGCGPNHLFLIGAGAYRFARLLGADDDMRMAATVVRKMCGIQADEGYFTEDTGPAVGYHNVSLFGLVDYYAASGDESVRPAVERGIDFAARALHPDLSRLITIDQRNRMHGSTKWKHVQNRGGGLGPFVLTFVQTPTGRRLAELALGQGGLQMDTGYQILYRLSMAAVGAWIDSGGRAARRLGVERERYVDRFDDKAAVLRRDGWHVTLSGYHLSQRPGNPFIYDRSENLSLFHDRHGLLIGGGNDKLQFDAATFEICESGYVFYFPPLTGRVKAAGGRGTLDLDFGSAKARLVARILSDRQVELLAGATTNYGHQANRFNLQLPFGVGTPVRIDGKPLRLADRKTQKSWPVKRVLQIDGLLKIETPGGAAFCWPHHPWACYNNPTYRGTIATAVSYLRLALSGKDIAERTVKVTVL